MKWQLAATSALLLALASGCKTNQPKYDSRVTGPVTETVDPTLDRPESVNAKTHFAAGQVNESQNRTSAAVEQYTAALKLDPNYSEALFALAVLQTRTGEYDQAIAAWERYVRTSGQSAAAWTNLGFCYELAKKPAEAEVCYRRAVDRDAKHAGTRVKYGLMLARQSRMGEAADQLSQALKPAEVQYNIGSVYEQQGKLDLARRCFKNAIELDPTMTEAKSRLAQIESATASVAN
jgi:tetratricopeptide (TPR) repeat protein